MKYKICTKCGEKKQIEEFKFKNKTKGWRHSYCNTCQKLYAKKHYIKNKKAYVDRARIWNLKNKEKVKNYLYTYLSQNSCKDCGENDILVLEFDHVRDVKKATICSMLRNNTSLKTIKIEVAKCEVRCANCHRRKHSILSSSWKNKYIIDEQALQFNSVQ